MLNTINCKIQIKKNWFFYKFNNNEFFVSQKLNDQQIDECKKIKFFNKKKVKFFIKNFDYEIAGVIKTNKFIFVFNDWLKKKDFFIYRQDKKNIIISDSINFLKNKKFLPENQNIMLASGYLLEDETIYKNIKIFKPATLFCYQKKLKYYKFDNYFKFTTNSKIKTIDINKKYNQLDNILNKFFLNFIKKYKNKKKIVFLSGGYDSRLVISKLHELKCKNIIAVSYGNFFTYENYKSYIVAKKLKIPWKFISLNHNDRIEGFLKLKKYYKSTFNYKALPCIREFSILYKMNKCNLLKNSVLLNGQSGDFISGLHIPFEFIKKKKLNAKYLVNFIIKKHFSNYSILKVKNLIFDKIFAKFKKINSKYKLISMYENWEFENRQANVVIQDFKAYEFFKKPYAMPLWDLSLVKFFNLLPQNYKYYQKFYYFYLKKYNYKKIFNLPRGTVFSQPLNFFWVFVIANILGLINKVFKKKIYYFLRYFSYYNYQYKIIGFKKYLKFIKKTNSLDAILNLIFIKH